MVASQTAKTIKNIPILEKLDFQYSTKKIIEIKASAVVPEGRIENKSINIPPIKVRIRFSVMFKEGAHKIMVMRIRSGATPLTLNFVSSVT